MTAAVRTRERLEAAIGGRFTITRELGGGGMSDTFVARDTLLGRDIVVKALAPALASEVSLERFSREIQFSAALQHPNLVPVLDSGVADGLPYFTMPYVAGDSLRRKLTGTPMPVAEAVSILRDVARGLGAAHAHGVVHRDIKPDNVLLTGDAALVTDLGIAKALSTAGDADRITKTGIAIGTPAYFAPEQAAGDAIDARADWYAFGVMAFEMLTGRLPFMAPTDAGLLVAHVTVPPPDIRTLRTDLPEPLSALVMACLDKEPANRPASSADVIAALAGKTAWSTSLYARARADGETQLAGRPEDAALAILVAEARRRTGDAPGAYALLERAATSREVGLAERATGLLALVALETGKERDAQTAVARLTRWETTSARWTTALSLARVEARRRNLSAAMAQLRRAMALGLPRERTGPAVESGELRADADLAAVFATPEGRALMLANE